MRVVLTIIALTILALIVGCGGNKLHFSDFAEQSAPKTESSPAVVPSSSRSDQLTVPDLPEFYLSYGISYKIRSDHPDSVHRRVEMLGIRNGGFILESNDDVTSIRVLAERQLEVQAEIESLGEVADRRITGQDVTDAYYDLQIRLENARRSHERYLKLLDEAKDADEAARIEMDLERLSRTIDLLEGKIRQLDKIVNYADFTVRTARVIRSGYLVKGLGYLYGGVKSLFVR